jgi:hypothetical protein
MELGVRRCLNLFQSGRDFLQHLADKHDISLKISTFFTAAIKATLFQSAPPRVGGRWLASNPWQRRRIRLVSFLWKQH